MSTDSSKNDLCVSCGCTDENTDLTLFQCQHLLCNNCYYDKNDYCPDCENPLIPFYDDYYLVLLELTKEYYYIFQGSWDEASCCPDVEFESQYLRRKVDDWFERDDKSPLRYNPDRNRKDALVRCFNELSELFDKMKGLKRSIKLDLNNLKRGDDSQRINMGLVYDDWKNLMETIKYGANILFYEVDELKATKYLKKGNMKNQISPIPE